MTSELRPAVEVWWKADTAFGAACLGNGDRGDQAAAAVIEADREAVRAEQAAELAKFKALAETLAGALEEIIERGYVSSSIEEERPDHDRAAEALRQYKEARDER